MDAETRKEIQEMINMAMDSCREAQQKPIEKYCATCRYKEIDEEVDPCASCSNNFSQWQPNLNIYRCWNPDCILGCDNIKRGFSLPDWNAIRFERGNA